MPDALRSPRLLGPLLLGFVGGLALAMWLDGSEETMVLSIAFGVLAGALVHAFRRIDALQTRLDHTAQDALVRERPRPVEARAPGVERGIERGIELGGLPGADPSAPRPTTAPDRPAPIRSSRPAPAAPKRSALPPEVAAALGRAWAFASGGNPIVRVAVVVLFVGFGVGIRYAAQLGLFPIEARLAAAGLAGLGLVGLGWSLREKTPGFGLAVQGGGVGLLYLTVYAAYALANLLGAPVALGLMAAVALLGGVLAVVQDAPGLAFLGALGGFAAPVVASTGSGDHVLLFSYYLALGVGIGVLVWRRGWRSLAVLGVIGTFGIGGLWGGLEYRPELYASTQPFLIAFFALYFVLALRLAWLDLGRDVRSERDVAVDGTLIFGLPAATFVLQQGLVEGMRYGSAWSAAALAVVYLGVWAAIRRNAAPRLLNDALLAVGLAFATLALPLAFQRVVVGALWSLEAAALVWTGARQNKLWMRLAGIALGVGAATVLFAEGVVDAGQAFTPETLTGWIVAVSLGLSAYVLWRTPTVHSGERAAGRGLLAGAILWWGLTAATHADTLAPDDAYRAAVLGALGLSAILFAVAGRALGWPDLRRAGLLASTVAAVATILEVGRMAFASGKSPFDVFGWIGWPVLLGAAGLALVLNRTDAGRAHGAAFALGLWSTVGVLGLELWSLPAEGWGDGWRMLGLGAPVVAALAAVTFRPTRLRAVSTPAGRAAAGGGLAAAAAVLVLAFSGVAGSSAPLPSVPLLSPADLTVAALLAVLAAFVARRGTVPTAVAWGLGTLALVAIGGVVARGAHALAGVPFEAEALFDAAEFQAALAVAWAVLALALTVTASRRGSRALWTAGVIVLALVVVKLFVVDLSRAEALVRVGAFLAVGALMLWIGYRSPLPPRPAGETPDPESDPTLDPGLVSPEALAPNEAGPPDSADGPEPEVDRPNAASDSSAG